MIEDHRTTTHLQFFGLHDCIIVSKAGGAVLTELPVQALVYYESTMHKPEGNSLDNNPAKAIMLQHLGDIGEESCILDQSY